MTSVLEGLPGVEIYQDDIIIYDSCVEEHYACLNSVLDAISKSGLKLNREKCTIRKDWLEFLGHEISKDGLRVHPENVEAIRNMDEPRNIPELRRFPETINYLGKIVKDMSVQARPQNEL